MSQGRFTVMREGALWGSAAALVVAAHLGGALWLLHEAQAATPPGLPEPVFVDLAPEPEMAAPPDEVEAPELEESEPEPEIALPEPLPELEPVPDMNSLFPPPPDAVVLQKSERPLDRPKPEKEPEPKIVEKKPEPKKKPEKKEQKEEQPARQATTRVRAAQSDRTAAPQADGGQPSPRQVASWQSRVQSAVARHMARTRLSGRGSDLRVTVVFTIGANGAVSAARLAGSTGDPTMDAAINRQAARLPRMPAHPSGRSMPMNLPVVITR